MIFNATEPRRPAASVKLSRCCGEGESFSLVDALTSAADVFSTDMVGGRGQDWSFRTSLGSKAQAQALAALQETTRNRVDSGRETGGDKGRRTWLG